MKLIVLVVLCLVWLTESLQDSLKGTHVVLDNIEFVYQLPLQKPNGIVFFAHGCSHHARDWWPKGETCQNCVGLPIEMSITHGTLSRGYVALAITAANQEHHCWTEEDLGRVNTVFKHLYSNILNDTSYSLPLFAIGGSSGGSFVGLLAQHQNVAPAPIAVSIQISYTRIIANNPKAHFFFLPMLKDSFTLTKIEKSVTRIKHHAIYSTREKAINKNFFQVYGFGIFTVEESEKIYQALINANIIDSKSNLLIEDPRRSNWRNVSLFLFLLFMNDR